MQRRKNVSFAKQVHYRNVFSCKGSESNTKRQSYGPFNDLQKLNNHLCYSLKCPHGGTAKYTQNEDRSKDVFLFNHCFKFVFFFNPLICISKIISAFNITVSSEKYLHHKTDKLVFFFFLLSASVSHTSSSIFVLLHKTKNKRP